MAKNFLPWTPIYTYYCFEDVLKMSSEDEDERRLQDIFKISSSRRMFGGYIHLLIR